MATLLKLRDLAERIDLRVGPLTVSPSRRLVKGPAGEAHLQPLIMHVFLLLLDARGKVVTRDTLFEQCWGGVYVGDDSLNRTVGMVRRMGDEVAPGLFEVETIPRTGYRLAGPIFADAELAAAPPETLPRVSRRGVIVGGAALAAVGGGTAWLSHRQGLAADVARDLEIGRRILRDSRPGGNALAAAAFRQALRRNPANAEGWGLLSVAMRNSVEEAEPRDVAKVAEACETAARRALAINAGEPNARMALATLKPEFGDWGEVEDALRGILRDAPSNIPALSYLTMLLQSVGRAKASWDLNERSISLEPLSPTHQFRRALKLWIFGRLALADLTIDRALQLWPRHPAVWNARLYLFAFTGRAEAGLRQVADRASRPPSFTPEAEVFWVASLRALASGASADVSAARAANVAAAPNSPAFAVASIMVLSSLSQIDSAFAVAEGTLLRRGPLIGTIWGGRGEMPVTDQYWRRTMNLFTPATAAMRADARFVPLCDGIGMVDYWRKRGVWPDAMYRLPQN